MIGLILNSLLKGIFCDHRYHIYNRYQIGQGIT